MFKKATKEKLKLRLLIEGASGSGKTYSALRLACAMGKKVALIDTEKGSSRYYSETFSFDVSELDPPYEPLKYIQEIKNAEDLGYDVIIIDSITHEWIGEGGCLDMVNKVSGTNTFTKWGVITPKHNRFVDTFLGCKSHLIATARTKTDYSLEQNDRGKMVPIKKGLKTEQRDGLDYEFTTVLRLNEHNIANSSKDRTGLFKDYNRIIDEDTAKMLLDWLDKGEEVKEVVLESNLIEKDILGLKFGLGKYSGKLVDEVDDKEYLSNLVNHKDTPDVYKRACQKRLQSLSFSLNMSKSIVNEEVIAKLPPVIEIEEIENPNLYREKLLNKNA